MLCALLPTLAFAPGLLPSPPRLSPRLPSVVASHLPQDHPPTPPLPFPNALPAAQVTAALLVFLSSSPASAASSPPAAVPSALCAYAHFLSLLLFISSLTAERVLIKNDMTEEEFDLLTTADSVYGLAGVGLAVSGYLRVTQYAKGWEFYQHEPIFWLKITLLAVLGAASFFPTTKIIQRALAKRGGESVPPMSPMLVSRMESIINAELLGAFSIPLTASLMARGVGYVEGFPWQVGAAPPLLVLFGLGYKYIKEALDWSDDM